MPLATAKSRTARLRITAARAPGSTMRPVAMAVAVVRQMKAAIAAVAPT